MPDIINDCYCDENPCKECDYYAILNVPRDATPEQIILAYRKRAIQCHPYRDKDMVSKLSAPEGIDEISPFPNIPLCTQWVYINQAFDVLSNALRREVYDRYGTYGLSKGVALPNGHFHGYKYHGNCFKTFNEVFGSDSPYANIIDALVKPPPLYNNKYGIGVKYKDDPIEKNIYLDLKEIFTGTIKRMKILRYEICDYDKSKTENKEKVLIVPIAPGTLTGTRITFREEGDQFPTRIPADIVFITVDKPHDTFTRKESDLHMTCNIDLKQSLCGFKFSVQTIDNRKLKFIISDVIHPNYVKEIYGEGLPKPGRPKSERGNLYVHFNVKFPELLSRELRGKFSALFEELRKENENKA